MTIEIQFIEGKKEEILPIIKLTKSKNRGFYEFEVKEPGRYKFILDNQKVLF